MDEKEIKSLLKQARESIRKKEYKDAMRHAMVSLVVNLRLKDLLY